MTITVKVLIEGNKAAEVKVTGEGSTDTPTVVQPGQFTTKMIHGSLKVEVQETGEFTS